MRLPYYLRLYVPAKYYYVDFVSSSHVPQDAPDKLVVGRYGRDQYVPELSDTVPYDPFKVDIYIIGNVLFFEFLAVIPSTTSLMFSVVTETCAEI